MPAPLPSSWIYYPTVDSPSTRYKFASIEINFTLDQKVWTRQTYSFLDWLGDLGGLYDAIYLMMLVFLSPFTAFTLRVSMLTSFFRLKGESFNSEMAKSQSIEEFCPSQTLQLRRRMSVMSRKSRDTNP